MHDSPDVTPPGVEHTSAVTPRTVSPFVDRRARLRRHVIHWLPQASFLFVAVLLVVGMSLQARSTSDQSAGGRTVTGPASITVYAVSAVINGLWQDPSSWVGRTIQVNGVLQGPFVFCGNSDPCPPATLGLVSDGNGVLGSDQYLPVVASATQHPPFNLPRTFSVRIEDASAACALNPAILCYQAVLQ